LSLSFPSLRPFLAQLRKQNELVTIDVEVDAHLELAEVHRRIIAENGPALFFTKVRGSRFPVVTNLFGTRERVELAFGTDGQKIVQEIARLPIDCVPPSLSKLWAKRHLLFRLARIGASSRTDTGVIEQNPVNLSELPIITSWPEDGGPFITLPLVYTEDPETGVHNLGIYRMQRHSSSSTGMHMQIGKGGGFHLWRAKELGKKLPVNVFLGGPPVAILAAIAPLPENVPELLLASLLLGSKLPLTKLADRELPLLADAEFVLSGTVDPNEIAPEGPFGDHYGYYSLKHDFPVFRVERIFHKHDAIYPATVVGKPRQEDYYIGNYLQELLRPLFPVVMPSVRDLWSYGETGYHSLAAAVVRERYSREALVSAFRILGEGQLSLTKFLLLLDKPMDLTDFKAVFEYILSRADFRSDLYVFANLSMDTLDYTGPTLNHGSKGVLVGIGPEIRRLPREFTGTIPRPLTHAKVYCGGCLCLSGPSFHEDPRYAQTLAEHSEFSDWPVIVLCDDAENVAASCSNFLWNVFTRFEPAGDLYARRTELYRLHPALHPPIVIDARMKPTYPGEVRCDEQTEALVTRRWNEYFRSR